MVLVPPHTPNVVPGCCLMALEALRDFGSRLVGRCRGDHREMLHVVAWRSLVALGAVPRRGGWMAVFGDRPLRR